MDEYAFTQKEADSLYFPKKMARAISVIGDEMLVDAGIKTYHLAVLRSIYTHEGSDQKSIRKAVPFDKSRISVIVRELIDDGLIEDKASGRSSALFLTEKGKQAVYLTPEFRKKVNEELFKDFKESEINEMARLFEKLNDRMDEILGKDSVY